MKIVRKVSNWQVVRDYLNAEIFPLATAEMAKCAKGRKQIWLNAEPNYVSKKYKPAHKDERVWKFCKNIFPEAALAQIYFADGNIGIDWHRDASYAGNRGRIFNLGNARLETIDRAGDRIELELKGGEVVEFDTKLLHRAILHDSNRVGIGMWIDKIHMNDPNNWE